MPCPSESGAQQYTFDASQASCREHFNERDPIPSGDSENTAEASNVEVLQALRMFEIQAPRFTTIEQHRQAHRPINLGLCGYMEFMIVDDLFPYPRGAVGSCVQLFVNGTILRKIGTQVPKVKDII